METVGESAVRRAFTATAVGRLLLVLVLLGCWVRFGVVNPSRNYQLDFRAFYATGKALHAGINPYDLEAKKEHINPHLPGRQSLMGYAYPPPTLPLMYAIALLPLPAAQIVWAWFQFGLLLAATLLLFRGLGVQFGSPVSLLIAVPFWLSSPVFNLFRWGQFDGIRAALVGLAVFLLLRRRMAAGGMAIALAALAKVYPVAYLWVFVLRREWKALFAGTAVVVVLMALGLAALTPEARARYLFNNQDEFSEVDWVISPENMSVIGFVHRALVDNPHGVEKSQAWLNLGPDFARWVIIVIDFVLIAGASIWVVGHRRPLGAADGVAMLVPVVLLCELNAWPHHCMAMLIPIAMIVALAARQERLAGLDAVWVGAIVFLYTFCPVHEFGITLPKRIEHIVGPTTTYAMVLTWLFMLVRYPVLMRRAVPVPAEPGRTTASGAMPRLPGWSPPVDGVLGQPT